MIPVTDSMGSMVTNREFFQRTRRETIQGIIAALIAHNQAAYSIYNGCATGTRNNIHMNITSILINKALATIDAFRYNFGHSHSNNYYTNGWASVGWNIHTYTITI